MDAAQPNVPQASNGSPTGEKRKRKDNNDGRFFSKKAKVVTKALKAKRPGFSEERFNETSYYLENGLRKVYPYNFTFTTFCKGRWVGEKVIDVFSKEFRAYGKEEYHVQRCISSGTLTVNFKAVDADYRLQQNDLLANIVHRHEVPVADITIKIIHMSDELVVVDKPASIPVHPCGRYRHNTMAFILAKEYDLKDLRTIHRLDRLTSGVLMFGRTAERARKLENQIRGREVVKEYVCRVEGEFPEEPVICNEPIEVVSYKIGVCRVSPKGKDCRTDFKKLCYNGKTSVVLCRPYTGRMHQIRVHLQYLGFPIINDPLYNHSVFGPQKGKNGWIDKSSDTLIEELIKIHSAENWVGLDGEIDGDVLAIPALQQQGCVNLEPSGTSLVSNLSPASLPSSPPHPVSSLSVCVQEVEPSNTPEVGRSGFNGTDSNNSRTGEENLSPEPSQADPSITIPESQLNPSNTTLDSQPIDPSITNLESSSSKTIPDTQIDSPPSKTTPDPHLDPSKITSDPHCFECKVKFRDPQPKDLIMFLHALRYKGPDWSFETEIPAWATADWKEDS